MKVLGFRSGKGWKKVLASIFYVFIALTVLSAIVGNNDSDQKKTTKETTGKVSENKETPKKEVKKKESVKKESVPTEYKNALNQAKNYLALTGFSKSGLGKQLEFENYSKEAVNYALTQLDKTTNWNEQAVKKAQSYLDNASFSKANLIKQLEFEGFTKDQATYGADKAYK